MKMRIPGFVITTALVLGAFGAGVMTGVPLGIRQFALQEGSVKAALLTGELRTLRAGEAQKLIGSKEVELDGEIVKALAFRDHGYAALLLPLHGSYEHERYLRIAARYRTEHPAAALQLPVQQNTPMTDEMKAYAQEVREQTHVLLRDYAK